MSSLEQRIGYQFKDAGLLKLALTHPSVHNQRSNQRLEFLGDSILGAVVAKIIYDMFPKEQEGELARRQAALVCGDTLTKVARELNIGEALDFGLSEVQAGGHNTASNLEDALEALVGAMYLDGGMETVEAFLVPRWKELAKSIQSPPKDSKTALQEWAQARALPVPSYTMLDATGPSHAPIFTIEVSVQGYPPAQAKGNSKRVAEQTAAQSLLEALNNGK
jgi:ribonuclease-3